MLIGRNLWIIRHLKACHPPEMRGGFSFPSLVFHSLFGNASSLILKLASYGAIGYFFKIFAFTQEGYCDLNPQVDVGRLIRTQEACEESVPRGAWVRAPGCLTLCGRLIRRQCWLQRSGLRPRPLTACVRLW